VSRRVEITGNLRQNLDVDLIIWGSRRQYHIAFTVTKPILKRAEAVVNAIVPALRSHLTRPGRSRGDGLKRQIAKVSIAGAGMIGRPGVAAQMLRCQQLELVQMISTKG